MIPTSRYGLYLAALLLGCGAARPSESSVVNGLPPEQSAPAPAGASSAAAPALAPPAAPGVLTRADVEAVVSRGFPAFLATVDVAPVLRRGRFVGFRLERAVDLARWRAAGADIRLGDVITGVNGHSVERPESAYGAFVRLRAAAEVRVDLVRDGEALTVRQPILDNGPERGPSSSPTPNTR